MADGSHTQSQVRGLIGSMRRLRTQICRLLVGLSLVAVSIVAAPAQVAQASISQDSFEACLLERINDARAAVGSPQLHMATDKIPAIRVWSEWMRFNTFKHMPASVRYPILPPNWNTWGENIAAWSDPDLADCSVIHNMLMNSRDHRANIVDPSFRFVALGAYVDGSGWWVTQLFFNASDYDPVCNGTFCDDDTSIFENAIEKIAAAGITLGCNPPANTNFCPDLYVTRGEMAAFLSRALNLPASNAIDFIDDNHSIFESSIQKIAAAGITLGCNPPANTKFCPGEYVTRGQMAAFLTRALQL